jgi:hypothetical protein
MEDGKFKSTENDWDKNFIKDLVKRSEEFIAQKVKTYTWDETKQAAIKAVTSKKNS